MCDGTNDCPNGDDERNCSTTAPTTSSTTRRTQEFTPPVTTAAQNKTTGPTGTTAATTEASTSTPTTTARGSSAKTPIQSEIPTHGTTTASPPTTRETFPTKKTTRATTGGTFPTFPPTKPTCTTPNFPCDNSTKCLNASQLCDGKKDCSDNSDETGCPTSCPPCIDFKCHTTCQCIPKDFVCDGSIDCNDGSDEKLCPSPTPTEKKTTVQPTTPTKCDGNKIWKPCVYECEASCHFMNASCPKASQQPTCKPGCACPDNTVYNGTHCIQPTSCPCKDPVTNQIKDSGESWDRGCDVCTCFNNTISCQPKVCPTPPFCPAPSMELVIEGCCKVCRYKNATTPKPTTSPCELDHQVECEDGKCIEKSWLCDGERDCPSGSDERNCPTTSPPCFDELGKSG